MAKRKKGDDEADGEPKTPSDAYVGMLGICLVALLAAAVLLFLDADELDAGQPRPADPSVKLLDTGLAKPKLEAAPVPPN